LTSAEPSEEESSEEDSEDTTSVKFAAEICGDMLEAICINGKGITEFLVDRCDVEKHGENAIGEHFLFGVGEFIRKYRDKELSAGE